MANAFELAKQIFGFVFSNQLPIQG